MKQRSPPCDFLGNGRMYDPPEDALQLMGRGSSFLLLATAISSKMGSWTIIFSACSVSFFVPVRSASYEAQGALRWDWWFSNGDLLEKTAPEMSGGPGKFLFWSVWSRLNFLPYTINIRLLQRALFLENTSSLSEQTRRNHHSAPCAFQLPNSSLEKQLISAAIWGGC